MVNCKSVGRIYFSLTKEASELDIEQSHLTSAKICIKIHKLGNWTNSERADISSKINSVCYHFAISTCRASSRTIQRDESFEHYLRDNVGLEYVKPIIKWQPLLANNELPTKLTTPSFRVLIVIMFYDFESLKILVTQMI